MPPTPIKPPIDQTVDILKDTNALLVITGAGISAESGLPTYRGKDGIYNRHPELEFVLTAAGLVNNPIRVWEYINDFRIKAAQATPNTAHQILAKWEKSNRFSRFLIATQNIDGLHQAAGSNQVSELHGSVWQMAQPLETDYAQDEDFSNDVESWQSTSEREELLRRWSEENNNHIWQNRDVPFTSIPPYHDPMIRPNVLFFDESYGNRLLWVENFIRNKPDTVLVIGCSGGVALVERLILECRSANPECRFINVNPDDDPVPLPHIHLPMTSSEALSTLDKQLMNN